MRPSGRILIVAALAATVLAATLTAAAPASAAPYWQPYKITSSWACSSEGLIVPPPGDIPVSHNVYMRSCVVVSGVYAQAVLIVTNRAGYAQQLDPSNYARLRNYANSAVVQGSTSSCLGSSLASGQSAACFARTVTLGTCTTVYADVYGVMVSGGFADGLVMVSPNRRTTC